MKHFHWWNVFDDGYLVLLWHKSGSLWRRYARKTTFTFFSQWPWPFDLKFSAPSYCFPVPCFHWIRSFYRLPVSRKSDAQARQTYWIRLSSVLRPRQHSIGYMGDGFYTSKDPTNSIKVGLLKEDLQRKNQRMQTIKYTLYIHNNRDKKRIQI